MASAQKIVVIPDRGISAALKDFIDHCIVPALVRQYLKENGPAGTPESMADSQVIATPEGDE
jgi:hypothetical protein